MSLSDLSTEIDEMIIQYLPHHALHNLTLTNKYYRKIAEPHLYRNIHVRSTDSLSIPLLLLSLISRRELSQYIRSFALVTVDEGRGRDTTNLSNEASNMEAHRNTFEKTRKELFRKSPIIEEVLEKLAYPFRDPHYESNWYFFVLDATRSIDGALVLIICLALNLESLRLMSVQSEMTEAVCRARWKERTESASSQVYPLHKLKSLDVVLGKKASIPILTSMETLKVSGEGANHNFQWPRKGYQTVGTLRTLELRHINLSSHHPHRMLALPEMHGIQHLKMGNINFVEGNMYDYRRLSDLLQHLLPSLKTLEWTGEGKGKQHQMYQSFGSFTGFKQLEELVIGCNYMRSTSDRCYDPPAHLLHPTKFFPGSLKTLKVVGIPRWLLNELGEASKVSPTRNYILTTATSRGLSTFDLFLDMEIWSPRNYKDSIKKFLLELVSALNDVGTSMQVYRQEEGCESILLCGPGFVAEPINWDYYLRNTGNFGGSQSGFCRCDLRYR